MRTKHILTALAIPALFAACVADDFNESIATGGDSAQRALLSEDFTLDFGGVDTRFSAGDADDPLYFSYEVGDTIGGSIIDEFHPGQTSEFPVVPYVSTNHPFVLNSNGVWAINHTMVEGHYLFYFPYNENNHARTAAQYSIPVLQDLAGKDGKFDPKAAVEKYSMGVGVQFLDKTDLNASLQLVNIYGFAKIKVVIDNHYAGGYVDKIVLQSQNDPFALNGQISNKKVNELFELLEKSTQEYQTKLKSMTTTESFALKKEGDEAPYYVDELNETSSVMVAKAPEGTALVADAQNNKTFETYMVVPAEAAKNVTVLIYTTDGNVYSGEIANFGVTRNGVKSYEVKVQEPNVIPYVVTSEKDWNQYVGMLPKDKPADFIIAGSDFTVTNNTKYPTNGATINVKEDLTISGDNVTIKNVTAEKVIVKEGAKLTTDGTFAAGSIENHGTLEFAPVYDEEDEDEVVPYLGVKEVVNKPGAKMNILKDAIIGGQMGALTQYLKLTNEIDNKDAALPHGAVTVNGILVLANGSTNNGDITVTTTGSLRGTFTNNKETTYPVGVTNEEDIKNRYTPTITNNGEIFATGVIENTGKVVNNANAEISCSNLHSNAAFNNAGVIELGKNSDMLITDNAKGEIILSALDQTGWAVEKANGTVSYKTTSADNGKSYDFSTVGKEITKLYVTGDLGFTKYGKLTDVEVTANATLSLPVSTVGTLNKLTIKNGATVTATSKDAKVGTLVVEKNARLTINADNKMSTQSVQNSGRIYVGGTFATEMLESAAKEFGGEFRNTVGGENGNITFGQSEEEIEDAKKKEAYKKSLQDLVATWLQETGLIKNGDIDSWKKVTVESINRTTWSSTSTEWVKTAREAVVEAYKDLYGKELSESEFVTLMATDEDVAKIIENAIASEKAKANNALAEAMKAITPEKWLTIDVYVKADANAKILKNGGDTELKAGWKEYINSTYANEVEATNKPLYLSAKDYEGNDADVPAYSYINGYAAGYGDYEVMSALIDLVDVLDGKWFKGNSGVAFNASSFDDYTVIRNAMMLIYNKYYNTTDPVLPTEKKAIDDSKILDWYDDVVKKWLYTDNALAKLNSLVQGN